MISTNQLRNGLFIKVDGELLVVVEYEFYKPGKGGSLVRTKLRSLKTDNLLSKTFRSGETIEDVFVEEKKYQYLYFAEGRYHFMDNENYEEVSLAEEKVGDVKKFLKAGSEVSATIYEGNALGIKLPIFIFLKVTETGQGARGDTVKAGTKNATLETGATIQVPLFVNTGDVIKIDTRTGDYIGRT